MGIVAPTFTVGIVWGIWSFPVRDEIDDFAIVKEIGHDLDTLKVKLLRS